MRQNRGVRKRDFGSVNYIMEVGFMEPVLEQIKKIGIVPVVKIDRAEDALPLAKALCAGGLPCAEVTFRTDAAAEAKFPGYVRRRRHCFKCGSGGRGGSGGRKVYCKPWS